jgi:endo-1,4-beta-D-glucanase Y
MSQRTWGIFLLVVAFAILGFVAYKNSPKRRVPIIFSPRTELLSLWEKYKLEYLEPNTFRVLDKQKNFITTSEGESYAMLRAVWVDDKNTFDKTWQWTKDNLQREDKLISWLFGQLPSGSYGILTSQGGNNSAADADVDTALALVFASSRWNQEQYYGDAIVMIRSIWENEVITIGGKPYLVANNVEKSSTNQILVNPSYFAPYAYRIFAKLDPGHPWLSLIDTSYEVIGKSIDSNLDATSTARIPPDWVYINRKTAEVTAATGKDITSNMGYDAMRVPWRLALDWQWFAEPRAEATLKKMEFLSKEWTSNGLLYTTYRHDGEPVIKNQSPAFYGGTLGYFMIKAPETAEAIYNNKLQLLFNPDTNSWKVKLGYYDDNWAWFGIALYNSMLPNLAEQLTKTNS